ncbi:glycosyltransferase [Rathayibacter oskolensis]|uniref:glycosyltransferase n=1 Tax=Rathayibacter TaxID=33886 RepID=UPI001318A407|nr:MULTISPECIES: glycosyltransferase [Rathayibacter]QHC67085.1 glycosyltransferase [Rathayibacter sp. VKM Ac-2759]WKK71682.1 glycosyltransferase [Rathayibacter oskolensis]
MARILYLCVHDASYPRNALIRDHLVAQGHEVVVQRRGPKEPFLRASARIMTEGLREQGPFDLVVLSELALQYALVGKVVALRHRARYWVDAFVGMHESNVEDWGEVQEGSMRARAYRSFDSIAYRLSDLCMIDTGVRGEQIRTRGARQVVVVPVGAPDWVPTEPLPEGPVLEVLYYGNYIPLHGLDYVAAALPSSSRSKKIRMTFIGNGSLRGELESGLRDRAGDMTVEFSDAVTVEELGAHITRAHVVLGVFGTSPKAASVLANKLWQGLASGRTVINRDSPALAELVPLVDGQLISVDPERPEQLARALDRLVDELEAGRLHLFTARTELDAYVRAGLANLDLHVSR